MHENTLVRGRHHFFFNDLGQEHGTRENEHGPENYTPSVVVKKMGKKEMAVLPKINQHNQQEEAAGDLKCQGFPEFRKGKKAQSQR